jgi:carbamoyltransferase
MKILSVYPYTHVSSSALMINGKIVNASAEERFNREKMSTKFPLQSANWCLKNNNLKWEDLDLIVVPWNPSININNVSGRWINDLRWRGEMLSHVPGHILRALNGKPPNSMEIKFGKTKIIYLDHHECHAASAFYLSSFKKADVLTIDGHGEEETCYFGSFDRNNLKKLNSIKYPHSLGLFYGTFTDFLGFKPDVDEWKVMALSSYTKKNTYVDKVSKLIKLTKDGFELDLSFFDYYTFDRKKNFFTEKFTKVFGKKRLKNEKISHKHYEVAFAMQLIFERTVDHLLKVLKKKSSNKTENLVLAGGAAMNCVYNGKLLKNKTYAKSFIPSCPDDLGVSIGALLLTQARIKPKAKNLNHNNRACYWGPSFDDDEILKTIKTFKLKYTISENLFKEVATEISQKKIIGWFQGGMEFGHRALGNRSILADPRDINMQKAVNKAVKFRETFRPFAPAVIGEKAHQIFDLKKNEEILFMERAVQVKKGWKNKIQAVCHVDNSARVQSVYRNINPKFYKLIEEYNKITNIPVLLNTSYNLNGEPIVCTPTDAIRTFFSCGLDVLVLGKYIIRK